MNTRPTPSVVTDDGLVEPNDEDRAWTWLESKWLNIEAGHDPNDRDYSADEMVDAFMAGAASDRDVLVSENARLREAAGELLQAMDEYAAASPGEPMWDVMRENLRAALIPLEEEL